MTEGAGPENSQEPTAAGAPGICPGKAVFLSYASQDAEAAGRIAEALRAVAIEVWFDRSELRGGDHWDQMIRRQIKDCYLFVPIISANTQAREEGYFRREWKIAVDRTNDMVEDRAFLLPIVVDGTSDSDARVPEKFREVQWTRLPAGANCELFVQHARRLLSADAQTVSTTRNRFPKLGPSWPGVTPARPTSSPYRSIWSWIFGGVVLLAVGYVSIDKFLVSKHDVQMAQTPAKVPLIGTLSAQSVAVLPFVDMSEKKDQEYFVDGLSEELIDMLANVRDLKVPARTSSFYFKGKQTTIAEIANALGVSHVLEGSVRKSGNHLRITAQLIKADSGFHLWSHTYDSALTDTLKIQTEVATSVAQQLMLALASDVRGRMAAGGTLNPAAYDAYLRGSELYRKADPDESQYKAVLAELDHAVALDPKFALAHAKRATLMTSASTFNITIANISNPRDYARKEADLAVSLAPEMAETHLARAGVLAYGNLDFAGAAPEFERAMALSPGNAAVLANLASFESTLGHYDLAIKAARSATVLDPLNFSTYVSLGQILIAAGRYEEALGSLGAALALEPKSTFVRTNIGEALLASGANEKAIEACTPPSLPKEDAELCLAIAYHRLGRTAEAEQQFRQYKALVGDGGSVMIAGVYTQWGDRAEALAFLAKAEKLKDPQLQVLRNYWALEPIRSEPQFKAIEARMRFPP